MRLDQYLVEKGFVSSRSKATDLIKRKLVLIDHEIAKKAGQQITTEAIELLTNVQYVGRGGEKLAGAIAYFNLDFNGKIVIDVGASTGGFTDVSLRAGATHVFAYDVGKKQMDERLRHDSRVTVFEETNFLNVKLPSADIIVIDVSFLSITAIFEHIKAFKGIVLGLIKPQFEVGPIHMKHGVLKDKKQHNMILNHVIEYANNIGLHVQDIMASTLKGKKGNQEYMIYIDSKESKGINLATRIEELTC